MSTPTPISAPRTEPGAPRVSVVIPTYRGGPYLAEAVASVLDQTMTDFELIVVADGCPEEHLQQAGLADPPAEPRIRVIRQPNRGESVARNVGIRAARGELVAFVDDDDRMAPGRLAAQVAALDADPGAGLCYSQFRFIDGAGVPTGEGYGRPVDYLDLLRGELGVLMPTTMMRRTLLQEVGLFDATLMTGQDVDVIIRIAQQSRLAFVPEVLADYRVHATNASADTRLAGVVLEEILTKHLALARRTGDPVAVAAARAGIRRVRGLAGAGHVVHARQAWGRRDLATAVRSAVDATRCSPGVVVRDLIGNRRPLRTLASTRPTSHRRTA